MQLKKQVENALDSGNKNREKIKNFKGMTSVILMIKVTLMMLDHKVIQCPHWFLSIFKCLVVPLIKLSDGTLKGCQKKVPQLLLHKTIVSLQNLLTLIIPK